MLHPYHVVVKKNNIKGFALKSKRSELIKDQGIFVKKEQILGREFTGSYHNKPVKYGAFQLVSTFFIILIMTYFSMNCTIV